MEKQHGHGDDLQWGTKFFSFWVQRAPSGYEKGTFLKRNAGRTGFSSWFETKEIKEPGAGNQVTSKVVQFPKHWTWCDFLLSFLEMCLMFCFPGHPESAILQRVPDGGYFFGICYKKGTVEYKGHWRKNWKNILVEVFTDTLFGSGLKSCYSSSSES